MEVPRYKPVSFGQFHRQFGLNYADDKNYQRGSMNRMRFLILAFSIGITYAIPDPNDLVKLQEINTKERIFAVWKHDELVDLGSGVHDIHHAESLPNWNFVGKFEGIKGAFEARLDFIGTLIHDFGPHGEVAENSFTLSASFSTTTIAPGTIGNGNSKWFVINTLIAPANPLPHGLHKDFVLDSVLEIKVDEAVRGQAIEHQISEYRYRIDARHVPETLLTSLWLGAATLGLNIIRKGMRDVKIREDSSGAEK